MAPKSKIKRPTTQREIEKKKKQDEEVVEIINCGNQVVNIQTKMPDQDFYLGQTSVALHRNKTMVRPISQVLMEQLQNLSKRGVIRFRVKKVQ